MIDKSQAVMAGLDPAIHVEACLRRHESFRAIALSWMLGTSPGMTIELGEG
jgi:hypothetical protein